MKNKKRFSIARRKVKVGLIIAVVTERVTDISTIPQHASLPTFHP
jgi:hypothetical protein